MSDLKERVGTKAKVVAKIEKCEALEWIHQILELSDAVMVARGDLGVELPFEQVPMVQKRIIQPCHVVPLFLVGPECQIGMFS